MKKKRLTKLAIVMAIVIIFISVGYYWNNFITVSKYEFEFEEVDENSAVKIVQISDLHNKEFGNDNDNLIEKVKGMNPDIIAVTGDFIDSYHTDTEVSLKVAQRLVEIAPVYYITGNHERRINENTYYSFEDELREIGVIVLINQVVGFNEKIDIIGLDDVSLGDQTLKSIMDTVDSEKVSILLAHEPQEIQWYAECGADIVLSGHAHGGQVRIPFTDIGMLAPGQGILPKYTSGKHTVGDTDMIVSRGLGNSIFPLRVFNQPELVEIVIN